MNDARVRRQKLIAELIRTNRIVNQEEVTERLAAQGFPVNQATVSRDLEQIGAIKVRRDGVSIYALPDQVEPGGDRRLDLLRRLVIEWVRSADPAGNLIVLKTPPGSAHLVAHAIDQARRPDIVGTIAGDDTIFVAVAEAELAGRVAKWFRNPPAE